MNLGMEGRIALVTGGAHGIGAAIVDALTKEGARVVYTSRNEHVDRRAIKWSPHDDTESLLLKIQDRFDGRSPDILVNNNGHTLGITDPYAKPSDWYSVVDLNFFSAMRLSNALISRMKREKEPYGRIVNVTSCAGLENSGPVTYCVAKAALTAYTHSMGRVLATEAHGIVMSAVYPSVIKTAFGHWDRAEEHHIQKYLEERVPTGRFQTEEEFASVVVFYCSEQARCCHGAIIAADQGQSRHFSPHVYLGA